MKNTLKLHAIITAATMTAFFTGAANAQTESIVWADNYAAATNFLVGTTQVLNSDTLGTTLNFSPTKISPATGGTMGVAPSGVANAYFDYNTAQQGGESNFLRMVFDQGAGGNNEAEKLIANFSFNRTVTGLKFSILDVDVSQTGTAINYVDAVELYVNGVVVSNNSSVFTLADPKMTPGFPDRVFAEKSDNVYMDGFVGKIPGGTAADASPSEDFGNIYVDLGSMEVDSFAIRYFSSRDAKNDPATQIIGISDFTFNEAAVPEPGVVLLGLLGLVGIARRKR